MLAAPALRDRRNMVRRISNVRRSSNERWALDRQVRRPSGLWGSGESLRLPRLIPPSWTG